MCLRVRSTEKYLKAVGEVRYGFATGHIWECADVEDCDEVIERKLGDKGLAGIKRHSIERAVEVGRFSVYQCFG